MLDEAERANAADPRGRTDLRNIPLVTIDPEDARDHDDAVWAGPDADPANRGGHIAIVAIADVAHYVTPGSALDREACKRGNSAYFPDRVVPMLPEQLSADLCSLKENDERPCLAVRMVFDANGNKRRHEFLRGDHALGRAASPTSRRRRAFDGKPDGTTAHLQQERAAAAVERLSARWRRRASSAIRSTSICRSGASSSAPTARSHPSRYRERLESMRLIEEFMIMANVAAAESLEKARSPLIYRVHEEPSKEKLFAFADYLRTIGIAFAKGQVIKPGVFNRILAQAKDGPHAEVMNDVVLRTQAQASMRRTISAISD